MDFVDAWLNQPGNVEVDEEILKVVKRCTMPDGLDENDLLSQLLELARIRAGDQRTDAH